MRHPLTYPHLRARGFTLIELLVVISIVALLISILMPALSGARNVARKAQCMGNVHSLAVAATNYSVHNKGYFPPTGKFSQFDETYIGKLVLQNYVTHAEDLFKIPSNRTVFYCPSHDMAEASGNYINGAHNYVVSYASNSLFGAPLSPDTAAIPAPQGAYEGSIVNVATVKKIPRVDDVPKASKTSLYLDSRGGHRYRIKQVMSPIHPATGNYLFTTGFRHQDSANVVFADGHGETRSESTVPARSSPTYSVTVSDNWYVINNTFWHGSTPDPARPTLGY